MRMEEQVVAERDAGYGNGPDFSITSAQLDLQQRMRAFVLEVVIPHEAEFLAADGAGAGVIDDLRRQARAAGVYGPQLPTELGGLGCDWRTLAIAFEEAGASLLGPIAINGAAPDEGNMHLLHAFATEDQRARYLRPLADGRVRSAFAMTEPAPGAGSDPSMLQTTAVKRRDTWTIDGSKWFASGGVGAAFTIVMARTSVEADPRKGASLFIVDADNPGLRVTGQVASMDHLSFVGGHAELELRDCQVGLDALLGIEGDGFEHAQARLIGGRLTHCMRWLGAGRRCLEVALGYGMQRHSQGQRLVDHEMVQAMLADSAIDLHAARLVVWHAAWKLDIGEAAREETSIAKVFVPEAVSRIIDRAVQICGAYGVTDRSMLGVFYREIRPLRILDGPSEVHREAIARRLVRRHGSRSDA